METVLYVLTRPSVKMNRQNLMIPEGYSFTISCLASIPKTETPEDSTFEWFMSNGIGDKELFSDSVDGKYVGRI